MSLDPGASTPTLRRYLVIGALIGIALAVLSSVLQGKGLPSEPARLIGYLIGGGLGGAVVGGLVYNFTGRRRR